MEKVCEYARVKDLRVGEVVFILKDYESSEGWSVPSQTIDMVKSIEKKDTCVVVQFKISGVISYNTGINDELYGVFKEKEDLLKKIDEFCFSPAILGLSQAELSRIMNPEDAFEEYMIVATSEELHSVRLENLHIVKKKDYLNKKTKVLHSLNDTVLNKSDIVDKFRHITLSDTCKVSDNPLYFLSKRNTEDDPTILQRIYNVSF